MNDPKGSFNLSASDYAVATSQYLATKIWLIASE